MGKIDLKKFDKLVAEHEALVKDAEQHTLDAILKQENLDLLKQVDALIDRKAEKPVAEKTEVKTPVKSEAKEVNEKEEQKEAMPPLEEVEKPKQPKVKAVKTKVHESGVED